MDTQQHMWTEQPRQDDQRSRHLGTYQSGYTANISSKHICGSQPQLMSTAAAAKVDQHYFSPLRSNLHKASKHKAAGHLAVIHTSTAIPRPPGITAAQHYHMNRGRPGSKGGLLLDDAVDASELNCQFYWLLTNHYEAITLSSTHNPADNITVWSIPCPHLMAVLCAFTNECCNCCKSALTGLSGNVHRSNICWSKEVCFLRFAHTRAASYSDAVSATSQHPPGVAQLIC